MTELSPRFERLMEEADRDLDASRTVLALVRAEGRVTAALLDSLGDTDLTGTTFNILMEVAASPSGLPLNEIGRRLLKSAPNVTGLVDRLERCDYVRRSRTDADRRVVTAEITEKGWKALGAAAFMVFAGERRVLSSLSARDRSALRRLLDRTASPASDRP